VLALLDSVFSGWRDDHLIQWGLCVSHISPTVHQYGRACNWVLHIYIPTLKADTSQLWKYIDREERERGKW
jgi:hypothetical protein